MDNLTDPPRPTRGDAHHPVLRREVGPCYWRAADGREYFFREPALDEAASLWNLVRGSPPLEVNTPYCYLMLAGHFAGTCVVAERDRQPAGFVSAFVSPADRDIVF